MFNHFNTIMKYEIGHSLIELLIVIILETTLTIFLLKTYVITKNNEQIFFNLMTIQENAKTAMSLLNSEIHNAGYMGCQKLTLAHFPLEFSPYFLLRENRIRGSDHEIIVRKMNHAHTYLNRSMQQQNVLIVGREIKISPKDILMIADCNHAELFQVNEVRNTKLYQIIVSTQTLKTKFPKFAEIGKFERNRFYIAPTKRKDSANHFIWALFLEDIRGKRHELIEGVSELIITYLIKQQNQLVELPANEISDWSPLVGVNIALTLTHSNLHKIWYNTISLPE